MANKYATLVMDMAYVGPGGSSVTAPRKTISVPYQGQNLGQIDVPAGATESTSYTIPFGSVAGSATLVRIDNNTDARVAIKINGASDASHGLTPGASQVIAMPAEDEGTTPGPLLSMAAVLEAAATVGGTIDYWVFGDPT